MTIVPFCTCAASEPRKRSKAFVFKLFGSSTGFYEVALVSKPRIDYAGECRVACRHTVNYRVTVAGSMIYVAIQKVNASGWAVNTGRERT